MRQNAKIPDQTEKSPIKQASSFLFKVGSLFWGIFGIVAGIGMFAFSPWLSIAAIVLGILLLPPIQRRIGGAMGLQRSWPTGMALGIGLFIVIVLAGGDIQRKNEMEEARRIAVELEENRRDSLFIAQHPFVDRDSLRAWRSIASDSTRNSQHTLAAFLSIQQHQYESRRADSIASAKKWRQDSILAAKQKRQDSIREARRLAEVERRLARENQPETYNGHTVYTGPRGGRYYINSNGNKTYLR